MVKTGLIYKCTNKISGKSYVGQTLRPFDIRISRHIKDARGGSELPFHRALRKYGVDNFIFEILEDNIDISELNHKEILYIKQHDCIASGYNVALGGQGGTAHKTINADVAYEIIGILKDTNMTMSQIGSIYSISMYAISDINRGKSWAFDDVSYPVRNNGVAKRLDDSTLDLIFDDILNMVPTTVIANKYNINISTVNGIATGKIHKRDGYIYPLRKRDFTPQSTVILSDDDVREVINLLSSTNISIKDIANTYDVSWTTIGDINKGRTWRHIYSGEYPIRKK